MKCPKCQSDNPDSARFCAECGTQLGPSEKPKISHTRTLETSVEELTRGTVFASRYEIIEELGKGGMGKVYRVEDKTTGEELALKLIKPEISADRKTIERFSNELKLAHKISHRNVCRMFHLGEEEGTYYITMEYVPGEDLKSFLRRARRLDIGTAISITKQVCEGLTEAHRLGVVHRDLKPSNIMIDKEGNARIMDFGIARSLREKGITGAGIMVGTPEYMSPEQAEAKEVDHRSDIYSLGVILYEMVTGQLPFEGDTPLSIAMKHKGEKPKDPRDLNPQIPEDMNQLILKCMEKDKENRYQSAHGLHTELDNIEKGIPTTQREAVKKKPITSKEITVTFRLQKLLIPALVVIALVIVALILWQPWSQKEVVPAPSGKPSLGILYFENDSGNENLEHWRRALCELLITDLSQSKFIHVLSGNQIYSILESLDLLEKHKYSTSDLRKVASSTGVNHLLRGNFITAGDQFILNITVMNADSNEVISNFKVEGKGEESITDSIDTISKTVKQDLNLSKEQIAEDFDEKIGTISTNSPLAYKFYIEGREYFNKAEWSQCVRSTERALALDPEFAMAYRSAGQAYINTGNPEKGFDYIRRAFELSKGDRVSERERLKLQGFYYNAQSDKESKEKAIELYKRLVDIYPLDTLGNNQLGLIYEQQGDWEEGLEYLEVITQNNDASIIPYVNSSRIYRKLGEYDKSIKVCEKYINNFSDHFALRQHMARALIAQGKYDIAMEEANNAFALNPINRETFEIKGDIYYLKGNFSEAEKEYNKSGNGGGSLAKDIYITQGKFVEAMEIIKRNISKAKESGNKRLESALYQDLAYLLINIFHDADRALQVLEQAIISTKELYMPLNILTEITSRKGLADLLKNSITNAEKTARELDNFIAENIERPYFSKRSKKQFHHLKGCIEHEKQHYNEAIAYFNKALALEPHGRQQNAEFIQSLAEAYYKSGDLEKALSKYESINQLTTGRLGFGDIYAKSFYMLGKIFEQQSNTDRAIEHYEKFLGLWKDADPGIAEVEDAKERLAALRK